MKNKFKLLWKNKVRLYVFLALTIITLFFTFFIPARQWHNANILEKGIVVVRGNSMEPSVQNGTIMYVDKISYERGDIIAFENHSTLKYNNSSRPTLLKRIVGLPGETVEIVKEGILINGELLDEPYTDSADKTLADTNDYQEIVLSDREYFLVGDNRVDSFDSRHVGAINEADFLYKVTLEKNDYTKKIESKNLWTSIIILVISIVSTAIYFFATTIEIKKPQSVQLKKKKR